MNRRRISRASFACATVFALLLAGVCVSSEARAADPATVAASPAPTATPVPERYSLHAQGTDVQQYTGHFPAAYSGTNSLTNTPDTQKTIGVTFYLGARLWNGGQIYVNPEIDQGFGLGNYGAPGQPFNGTLGIEGFTSAEAYKVGRDSSYGRIQRAFLKQQFDFSGDASAVDPAINQLGGSARTNHLTLTAGKFAVTDVFDNNTYAHDPTNDFLNWTIIDLGSFDYAADAFGYTYGLSAELVGANQAIRAGVFQLSDVPNDIEIEHQPFLQYMPVVEYERDTSFFGGHPGSFKALFYGDDGYFGPYALAVAAARGTGAAPNTANVRGRYLKTGAGLNLAQEVAPHIGVFARLSAMNGTFEADEFTDVDRSLSGGISIDGALYHRPNDAFGLAGVANAISSPAEQYFAAGGLGILAGDGTLSYGAERIVETYYKLGLTKGVGITGDFQRVTNPAYNTARGPVSVFGLRYHAQI